MLIYLVFAVFIVIMPIAIFCIFIPIWIRHSHTQSKIVRKQHNLAIELNPLYQQKVIAERSHQLAMGKLELEQSRFNHQVQVDLAELWMKKHLIPDGHYIINTEISSITALPSLKAASQVKAEADTAVQQLPVAPPFSQIAHLMTPEHLILNYIETGPVYGQVDDLLSMALIGKPKRGKTTALLYYLCILLNASAEVWIWDPHGEMNELAYGLHYYTDLEDIAASAVLLEKELNERSYIYKTQNKRVKHPLVLLVDEVPVVARWEQIQRKRKRNLEASPYSVMERFTLEARKWRGFVFISGQSLPAEVLPTITRNNLSSRLVLECSADHARMIGLPKDTIDTLLPLLKGAERGTHIADFSSWSHPELADIPYTTIDDLRTIIDGRGNWGKRGSDWESPVEPLDELPRFPEEIKATFYAQRETSKVITGELIKDIEQPVETSPTSGEVPPDERMQIITIARTHMRIYGKVKRSEIPEQMGKNNRYYSVVKQVLDEEGIR